MKPTLRNGMIGATIVLLAAGAWFFLQTGDYAIPIMTAVTLTLLWILVVVLGLRR